MPKIEKKVKKFNTERGAYNKLKIYVPFDICLFNSVICYLSMRNLIILLLIVRLSVK